MAKSREAGPRPEEKEDTIESFAKDVAKHIEELANERDNEKDPETQKELAKILDEARLELEHFMIQKAGVEDELVAKGQIPEEVRNKTMDLILEIERKLLAAESELDQKELKEAA
jgi:hypothetical protein